MTVDGANMREMLKDAELSEFEQAFVEEWVVLEQRFRVNHHPEVMYRYSDILEQELTITQLQDGCRAAFRHCTFFPEPQAIVDFALGDLEEQAEDAWDEIIDRLAGGHDSLVDPGTLSHTILRRVGGSSDLRGGDGYTRRDMRKEFIKRYKRALRDKLTPRKSVPEPARDETPVDRYSPREATTATAESLLGKLREQGILPSAATGENMPIVSAESTAEEHAIERPA